MKKNVFYAKQTKNILKTKYRTGITVTKVPDIHAVKLQCKLWKKKLNRPGYITVTLDILDNLFSDSGSPTIVWPCKEYRPNFMSSYKLYNYTDKIEHDAINIRDTDNVDSAQYLHFEQQNVPEKSDC